MVRRACSAAATSEKVKFDSCLTVLPPVRFTSTEKFSEPW